EPAVPLGLGDHGERDAVLDRAARILALQLDEQPAWAGVELRQFHHRRLAYQLQHRCKGRLQAAARRRAMDFRPAHVRLQTRSSPPRDGTYGKYGLPPRENPIRDSAIP